MATVGQVALGIAARMATIAGLDVDDYVPDNITAPAAFVALTDAHEDTFGGTDIVMTFDAMVVTARTSDRIQQRALYDYASFSGTNSIVAAINADPTLALAGTRARVVSVRNLTVAEIAAIGYFGIAVAVEVTTPG